MACRLLCTHLRSKLLSCSNIREQTTVNVKAIHKAVGTFGDLTIVEDADKKFLLQPALNKKNEGVEPLVVILGWAGATHKNLGKYSQLYRERGCGTLQYILPTRFIFRHTEQVQGTTLHMIDFTIWTRFMRLWMI